MLISGMKRGQKKYYLRSIELKKQIGDERGTLFALANLTTLGSLPKEEVNGYTEQGFALAQQLNDPLFHCCFCTSQKPTSYLPVENMKKHLLYYSLSMKITVDQKQVMNTWKFYRLWQKFTIGKEAIAKLNHMP